MSRNNEAPTLILSLIITAGILGAGYWWFSRQSETNPLEQIFSKQTETSPQSSTSAPTEQLTPPSAPSAFPPPVTVPSGTAIRVDGSTSMAQINKALKDNFEQTFPQTNIEIDAKGSDTGIELLLSGQIDVAAVSRPLTDAEKAQGLIAVPIIQDSIAVVVGDKNTAVKNLTQNQVADIFQGKITDWSAVGGSGGTIRVINRPSISGTHQAFQELALKGGNFGTTPNITTMQRDATTPILKALGTDGISYATYAQVANQQTVRTVAIEGSTPEATNYPFQRTLYYVYKDPPSPGVQAFLGYTTAPIGRQVVATTNQ